MEIDKITMKKNKTLLALTTIMLFNQLNHDQTIFIYSKHNQYTN